MTRLWVDANVIPRFLTKDPPEMAEHSARLMAKAETGEVSPYISPLVLAEIIWVFKSFYRYSMMAMAHIIISLNIADAQPHPKAGARHARALQGVGYSAWLASQPTSRADDGRGVTSQLLWRPVRRCAAVQRKGTA